MFNLVVWLCASIWKKTETLHTRNTPYSSIKGGFRRIMDWPCLQGFLKFILVFLLRNFPGVKMVKGIIYKLQVLEFKTSLSMKLSSWLKHTCHCKLIWGHKLFRFFLDFRLSLFCLFSSPPDVHILHSISELFTCKKHC